MGASQNSRSGTRSRTAHVQYHCSIPPFHTCLKDPFHTPYISIPILNMWICFTFIFTYMSANTVLANNACKNTFTMPRALDFVGKSVLQHWQLLPTLPRLCCVMVGMSLAAALWQFKNGLLVTFPRSQLLAGLRLHPSQLLPTVRSYAVSWYGWAWLVSLPPSLLLNLSQVCACTTFTCCPLCDGRDALGCCQLAVQECATLAPSAKACCRVELLCWSLVHSRPCSMQFQTRTSHVPLTHPRVSKWQM